MKKWVLCAAALVAVVAVPASASILVNGSFEDGAPQPASGSFNVLGAGSTAVTGWVVGGDSVDWINGYWEAKDGTHSVDLSGNAPGWIQQTFATTAGTRYEVEFWMSGNPDGGSFLKPTVTSAIDGGVLAATQFYAIQGATHEQMNWLRYSFAFTGTGNDVTLRFSSDTAGPYGPALDLVSVTAVPEPATWAMMLGGFGLLGAAVRRSKRAPAVLA